MVAHRPGLASPYLLATSIGQFDYTLVAMTSAHLNIALDSTVHNTVHAYRRYFHRFPVPRHQTPPSHIPELNPLLHHRRRWHRIQHPVPTRRHQHNPTRHPANRTRNNPHPGYTRNKRPLIRPLHRHRSQTATTRRRTTVRAPGHCNRSCNHRPQQLRLHIPPNPLQRCARRPPYSTRPASSPGAKETYSPNNLGIKAITYCTPLLTLVWIQLLGRTEIARPDYLLIGALTIATTKDAINRRGMDHHRYRLTGMFLTKTAGQHRAAK